MLAIWMLVAAVSASPKPGELKSFDDWAVGCDNSRLCTAVSLMEMESGENQLTLQVIRGPNATDIARLRIPNVEARGGDNDVTLIRDGVQRITSAPLPADGAPLELQLSPVLLSALKSGLTLELRDTRGESLGSASLKGVRAALGHMDDLQLRAGTVTALEKTGPLPSTAMPAPPAIPNVVAMRPGKPASQRLSREDVANLQARIGCDISGDPSLPVDSIRIDGRHWLALIPCGSGSYNFMTAPILVSGSGKGRKMKPADFDFPPLATGGNGSVPVLANASWDNARGELVSFAKGRGLGDCGAAETYVWASRKFRLQTRSVMEECRGVLDWIPIWRVNVIRR